MRVKKYKASVIATTTIIVGIILIAALSISSVSIMERKASGGSNKSNQAYQMADSGIERVMSALLSDPDSNVDSIGLACQNNGVGNHAVLNNAAAGYAVELKKIDKALPTNCNATKASEISYIKSVGTVSGQSQRAIEAAVLNCGDVPVFNGKSYGTVRGADGKCWLDRNLGADRVATSFDDSQAYGWLFQWGRGADGHEILLPPSGTTSTTSSSDTPGDDFITTSLAPNDWRIPQNPDLWQGGNDDNNPCPTGFRLPTSSEWTTLVGAASITNYTTAFDSSLKLTASGRRNNNGAALADQGTDGYYWSRDVDGSDATGFSFDSSVANFANTNRAYGFSVRCIKD